MKTPVKVIHAGKRVTGSCGMQPKLEDTRNGWYFDAQNNYQHDCFIDAPEWVPSGSTSSMKWEEAGKCVCLTLTHVDREARHA